MQPFAWDTAKPTTTPRTVLVPSSLRTELYQILRGYIHMGFQRQWTVLLCVSDCPLLTAYPFPRHALAQHATSVRYEWSPHAAATKLLQLTPIAKLGQLCLNRNSGQVADVRGPSETVQPALQGQFLALGPSGGMSTCLAWYVSSL